MPIVAIKAYSMHGYLIRSLLCLDVDVSRSTRVKGDEYRRA